MHSGQSVVSTFPPFMPVRVLIVDEEHRSRERLRELLEHADETEVVGEFGNVVEALEAAGVEAPDLVFFGVKLPELTGLALLQALGGRGPQVIFVTQSHAKGLQRAMAIHGLDYLQKPFMDEQVLRCAPSKLPARSTGAAGPA